MTPEIFKYVVTAVFVCVTFYLSWIGMRKTNDIKGFSIGNKDMNPYLIGITMAASIASTATFVINPGFVYVHGLAAYMHYGVAASLGILTAFLLLTKGFRSLGEAQGSLTIPDWIYHRYGHRGLSLFFAFINLLSVTFVVLILVGCSLLMSHLFPISQKMGLTITLLFVFSYVLMGGTYAHAYTNTFQGMMMLVIALFLFFHGLPLFEGGFLVSLERVGADYAKLLNPSSNLYYDVFSVFISGFIITFALMLQPHILTKVLYLKEDRDVNKFIATTTVVGMCFTLILFVGFYAKLSGLDIARQDAVVTNYIGHAFASSGWGAYVLTFISITLLAAGMSTLDGILVALSAMVVNDLYYPLSGSKRDPKKGLWLSRIVLVSVGLFSYALAWNPPKLVGLFAQKGVYGLAAASLVPILFGVLIKREIPLWIISGAAMIGLGGHLTMNLFLGVLNPAVSSSYAILLSLGFSIVAMTLVTKTGSNTQKIIV
jgi:SSS family solute:Na+ symporter/sodium/pantothenate symporter